MKQNDQIALRHIQNQRKKQSKGNTELQNKVQADNEWTDTPWAAVKAATDPDSGGPCAFLTGLGSNMEPYVYVRLLKEDRAKTGLADKTNAVSVVNDQAIFRAKDANELLEDCSLKSSVYPDPGSLLLFLRVYDDDVGDDECLGQAILDIREVVDKRAGQEAYTSIPIYDEENGDLICHLEMSACWEKQGEAGRLTVKIFRLYDFREDIDAGESATAGKYLLYFFIYILIGAALFKAFEEETWGCNAYFDAVWFMVITITSVGYGDCFPETSGTKVLNFFMIIINILGIGWMFSMAVQQLIVIQERMERKLMGSIQDTMWKKGDDDGMGEGKNHESPMSKNDDFRTTTIMCLTLIVLTCMIYGLNSDEMCATAAIAADPNATPPTEAVAPDKCPPCWADGTCAATCETDWNDDTCIGRSNGAGFMNFWDVLQFTVVTMATVGYGDVSPATTWGKVYGMFFAMIGVAAMARLGALVVDSVMEAAHQEKMEKILGQTLTSLDELTVFDADNDGRIDKYEFLMKMLVMTHECSQDTIDRIMGRFAQIDVDGDGDIDADDFLKMLKKKVPGSPRDGDESVAVAPESKLQSA